MKWLLIVLILVPLGFVAMLFFKGLNSRKMEVSVGVEMERLKPCGKKPNCVSSFAEASDKTHFIEPMPLSEFDADKIKTALTNLQIQVVEEADNYIYGTHRSKFFGFVDDVELLYADGQLHFRSASRVGYSDMGANRKRVEAIKKELTN